MHTEKAIQNSARFFSWVIKRSGPLEVRILDANPPKAAAGYFDNPVDMIRALHTVSPRLKVPFGDYRRSGEARGIYFTLNKIPPDILARATNKIILTNTTVSDDQVERYKLILIDADPIRPVDGISSTRKEKWAAFCVSRRIIRWLKSKNIDYILADSGNGWHILIPVDFPNNPLNVTFVQNFLKYLDFQFSNEHAKVDIKVYNPARICKLYGTLAMTGSNVIGKPNMEDRPHRYSNIHWKKDHAIADVDIHEKLKEIDITPPEVVTLQQKDYSNNLVKIKEVLAGEGIPYREKQKGDRSIFELETCLLHTDFDGHNYECAIIVEGDGKLGFDCKHDDKFTWQDIREKINWSKYSKSIIPDGIDLETFFNGYSTSPPISTDPQKTSVSSVATPIASDSTASPILSPYEAEFASAYNRVVFPHVTYLIPECTLAGKGMVLNIGGEQGVGKTTVVLGGFLIPMTRGQYVFGRYECPKVKTFYVNSDCIAEYFMNRFCIPYGYDAARDRDMLLFFHTKSQNVDITMQSLMSLIAIAVKNGYELIVLDNRTTLFPQSIYGEKAQVMGLEITDWLKKLAIKANVAMIILDHIRKPGQNAGDFVTIHDILGSSTKSAEQVLGIQARYDVIKKERSKEKAKRIRRQGEGVVLSLKGIDKLDKLQYNLVDDGSGMHVEYDAFDGIEVKQDPEFYLPEEKEGTRDKVYNWLCAYMEGSVITYAQIAHDVDVDKRIVTRYLNELDMHQAGIEILDRGKKGRGFSARIKIISSKKIDEHYKKKDKTFYEIPLDL